MTQSGPDRRWSQFSLWSLLAAVSVCGPCVFVLVQCSQPFWVYERLHCGPGRYVEILRPREFCDQAQFVNYRVPGITDRDKPPRFSVWSCGSSPQMIVIHAAGGDVVGIADADHPDELAILVDFKSRVAWPPTWSGKVNPDARRMLNLLRDEHGELWLKDTEDGELTKPRSW